MRQFLHFVDGFVISLVFVQLFACTIVVLTVSSLVTSRSSADVPPPYRIVKLPALPTSSSPASVLLESYMTITELTPTGPLSVTHPADSGMVPQSTWPTQPAVLTPSSETAIPEQVLTGLPVSGSVSQGFGCSPYYSGIPGPGCGTTRPWFHDGIDLAAELGVPVRATLNGVVIFAGPDGNGPLCGEYRGYGLGVVVDNGNGWQALYGHLLEIHVETGQDITPDTVLGLTGNTGCTTGAHLHFGLRHNGELVDPALMVNCELASVNCE